jgi:hypothetical protein
MSERLAAELNEARAVLYDPDGFVLAFFGGHGIHVYDLEGVEVAYWSTGDFSRNSITADEAFESMREHLHDWAEVYAG